MTKVRVAKLQATESPTRHSAAGGPEGSLDAQAEHAEAHRMREVAERHARAHRNLGDMVRRLVDPKGEVRYVSVNPLVEPAALRQHPRRKWAADYSHWPSAPHWPATSLIAHPGDSCLSLADAIIETVGISVIGLRGVDLDNVVSSVEEDQIRDGNFKPLFITDSPDFSAFVSRGFSFEYVSTFRSYLSEPDASSNSLLESLGAKWGISRIVHRDDLRRVYREHPALAALGKHNGEMSSSVHRDRFSWIIETLRMTLALERFDVAAGLSDYLLAFFDTLETKQVIPAAKVLCRKFIAFGEVEQLRRFLFKNIASIKKDDSLYTWFSTYCTGEAEFLSEFATLPSGKLNFYYLSRRMSVMGSGPLPALVTSTDGRAADTNLILANHFSSLRDASLYKMFVNRAISKSGVARIESLDFSFGNFLSSLTFAPTPPVADELDLVSVIMSAHNAEATIDYAIRSILNQSYRNIELLVCDDGSSDSTRALLHKYAADNRVRLFQSSAQQGTYGVRNSLISEARGAYVTFHDSDDLAFPDRIERQLVELRKHGAAAIVGQWYRVTQEGEFVFSSDHAVARLAVVSLLAPREIFERFGPYRSSRIGADTEFYESLRLRLGVNAVRHVPIPMMLGLASGTSLTRSAGLEATEDGYRAPARRAYAAATARARLTGDTEGLPTIEETLTAHGLLMPHAGSVPLMVQS